MPYTMVGDAAFLLKTCIMRPYPSHNNPRERRVFNCCLMRAWMVLEIAFDVLASRWRILYRRINLLPHKVDTLVTTACILHNFLLRPSKNQTLLEERGTGVGMVGNRGSQKAYVVRDKFCWYFN
ncbi:hypothetical protein AAFF_G00381980 [Aldrovandia affinis]|uniref:DDE Tnp4 domain-containing protein n=1 Tax=Aldrovandia affinis TaxID=143900 RepID=A0AAD7T884_9TELE|nr:hypothetical protein AAFF_G00381980 [Aldrovandia affinis]